MYIHTYIPWTKFVSLFEKKKMALQYMTLMFSPDPNSSEMRIVNVICSQPFRP